VGWGGDTAHPETAGLLAYIPPTFWEEKFGKSPSTLIASAADNYEAVLLRRMEKWTAMPNLTLLSLWAEAAINFQNTLWAEALLSFYSQTIQKPASDLVYIDWQRLLPLISPTLIRENLASVLHEYQFGDQGPAYSVNTFIRHLWQALDHTLDVRSTERIISQLLKSLVKALSEASKQYQYPIAGNLQVFHLAQTLPVSFGTWLESQDKIFEGQEAFWQKYLVPIIEKLKFRAHYTQALQAKT